MLGSSLTIRHLRFGASIGLGDGGMRIRHRNFCMLRGIRLVASNGKQRDRFLLPMFLAVGFDRRREPVRRGVRNIVGEAVAARRSGIRPWCR